MTGNGTEEIVSTMEVVLASARSSGRFKNARFIESSRGRHHMSMMRTEMEPLARYLQEKPKWHQTFVHDRAATVAMSMAQLLDSRAGSAAQIWHADNFDGGWTVVVALDHVTPEKGPTALQLGTHRIHTLADFWSV